MLPFPSGSLRILAREVEKDKPASYFSQKLGLHLLQQPLQRIPLLWLELDHALYQIADISIVEKLNLLQHDLQPGYEVFLGVAYP